ncbi:MAG TPA: hypothetical protein VL098_07020 [Flavipsychrobacter sp.]|nr:hypothetical protein [Flavipsychrobacter sp.]
MKKILLAAATTVLVFSASAQDYKQVMQNTFLAFDTTQDLSIKTQQSNKLSLIAKKYADQWTAHYYNAYAKVQLSYMEKDEAKRDAFLDEGDKELAESITLLGKENDETYVLAAMLANARLAVKPQSRWQKYGKVFEQNLDKAKEVNPNNPRIYYVQGTSKFFTPKMWGGGKKAALPYFEKAQGLFDKENAADITTISWGKEANAYFLKESKGEDKE